MALPRMPEGSWGWREALLLFALLVVPIVSVLAAVPHSRELETLSSVTALVAGAVLFVASMQLYLFWRMASHARAGWLVTAAVFGSGQVLADAGLRYVDGADLKKEPGWLLLTELGVALTMLAMVAAAARTARLPDPMVCGLILTLAVTAARVQVSWLPGTLDLGRGTLVTLTVLVTAIYLAIGAMGLRMRSVPAWVRQRIAVVVSLLGLRYAVDSPVASGSWAEAVQVGADLGAALVMAATASALLRHGLHEQSRSVARMRGRLDEVEAGARADQERMHEIRSTIAGIATASRLLHEHGDQIDPARRERLRASLEAEMSRLERLLDDRVPAGPGPVDLDAAINPVLEAHRARGHQVEWQPSGHTVHGRPDDVAEVVNILLENAARHGDAVSRIAVTDDEEVVTIAVSDSGPGIPEEVRERIFDWGVRGPDSGGQGIGLNVARRLVAEQGGSLSVAEPAGAGTSFIIRLPAVRTSEENHDVDNHGAH